MMDVKNVMSPYKPIHWKREIDAFKNGQMVYPHLIHIDPMASCNHNCPFCSFRYEKNNDRNALLDFKDSIGYEKFVEIFEDGKEMGVRAVELSGGGEPSLHSRFGDIVGSVHDFGFELGVITNGAGRSFKTERSKVISGLAESSWVRFSVNAGRPLSYADVHGCRESDFDFVISNIRELVGVKSDSTVVGISFIVDERNYTDIREIGFIAEDLGVDYLRVGRAIYGEPYPVTYGVESDEIVLLVKKDLEFVRSLDFTLIDGFSVNIEDYGMYDSKDFCYMSCVQAVIGADLKLYPCCIWKYRPDGVICDLSDQGLKSGWESQERIEWYSGLDIVDLCGSCYYKSKNDLMKKILNGEMSLLESNPDFVAYQQEENPLHVNFI